MKRSAPPILRAGPQLNEVRHVCAFFTSDEEEHRVMLLFIWNGLPCSEKPIHVANPDQREEHLHRLRVAGIEDGTSQECGQLAFLREYRQRRAGRSGALTAAA